MLHIIIHTLKEVLNLIPFLFIAFLLIELIEHKFNNKSKKIISKSGKFGPLLGSLLGLFPQCGFSVFATNLYVTRIISLGTLIAIYLTTSDEMLPILLSEKVEFNIIFKLLVIKFIIGILAGFIIDLVLSKTSKKEKINYELCDDEHCHCEKGIFTSSIKHTLNTIVFIFIITLILNILMHTSGEENLSKLFLKDSIFGPFIASLIGLIPNCGASVVITQLYLNNTITLGSTMAGLLTGSGVAIVVLFKSNKDYKENLIILSLLYGIGVISGIIIDLIGIM